MKRILLTLILLAVLIGGWWWQRTEVARAARAWQPLAGGGEARILTITQGTTHRYQEPPPPFTKRVGDAIRMRSMAPLRSAPPGSGSFMSSGRSGLGVWLELRGAPQSTLPQNAELILPSGHTFYTHGASGGGGPGGLYRTTSIFDYIPARAKTLRYACKFHGHRVEFEFDNPAYRTDLPVWKGTPLPQTQQGGDLTLTLRTLKLERATDYSNRANVKWVAKPDWSITRDGKPTDRWFGMNVLFEDPSGQTLRECGLFDEPVWKVVCSVYRTNSYPFRDDEVHWLGTAGPDGPPEQTTQLFTIDPQTPSDRLKLAGVFGPGEYWYQNGAIVETAAHQKLDPRTHPMIQADPQTKKIRVNIDQPAVVIFGTAFFVYRDAEGHPARLEEVWSLGGSEVGRVEICALPKAPIRIGTASSAEPGVGKFEFLIPTPEKPGLKKTVAKP